MKRSETFTELLISYLQYKRESKSSPAYANNFTNNKFERINTSHRSHKYPQEIVLSNLGLFSMCTPHEWYLIGTISEQLKEYNCLWYCSPQLKKNGSNAKSIKSLINKKVLIRTETTNIYVVNPLHIRRGDMFTVMATTLNMLENSGKVDLCHITNKKPVKEYEPNSIIEPLSPQIGYGFAEDN